MLKRKAPSAASSTRKTARVGRSSGALCYLEKGTYGYRFLRSLVVEALARDDLDWIISLFRRMIWVSATGEINVAPVVYGIPGHLHSRFEWDAVRTCCGELLGGVDTLVSRRDGTRLADHLLEVDSTPQFLPCDLWPLIAEYAKPALFDVITRPSEID